MAYFLAMAFSLAVLVFRVEGGVVPAIYVFGDSLADVGNNNYLPGANVKANFPHNGVDYPGGVPTGRFSNGYNGIDFLGMPTSDVGNNNYLPGANAKANFPHNGVDYPGGVPTGRFSNGYNGIDFLGMPTSLSPSFCS